MATDLSRLENLFLENDIGEVRKLERKTRADIEAKKEELRQTVGEKYRGLMDSADVVKKMRSSAQKLTASVETISRLRADWEVHVKRQQLNASVRGSTTACGNGTVSGSSGSSLGGVSNAVVAGETVWSLVSAGDFVQGVRVYVQSLEQLANCSESGLSGRFGFPLYPLRESAVRTCRAALRQSARVDGDEGSARSVYALMQLEGCSLDRALDELLEERLAAIRTAFARPGSDALLDALETVQGSVRQTVAFASGRDGTLSRLLGERSSIVGGDALRKLEAWFEQALDTIGRGATDALARVHSLPQLATVRDSVCGRLTPAGRDGEAAMERHCRESLAQRTAEALLHRATGLLDDAFERATLTLRTELERALADNGATLADVVFADSFVEERGTQADSEVASWLVATLDRARFVALQLPVRAVAELNCKSRFYSLSLARFARALDQGVADTLRDVDAWLSATGNTLPGAEQERTVLAGHIGVRASQLVAAALSSVARVVDEASTHLPRLVLLARLCDALVDLCPALRRAVSQQLVENESAARRAAKRTTPLIGDDARWIEVKAKVRTQQALIGRLWLRAALEDSVARFSAALDNDAAHRTQALLLRFEAVEIVEESEDGRLLHSAIRVPHAASTYVHEFLHALSARWSAALIGALPRTIQLELLADAVKTYATAYKDCFDRRMDQHEPRKRGGLLQKQALQFWFDLTYLVAFLPRDAAAANETPSSHSSARQLLATLIKRVEALIDPIDMYVCAPHVQRNLNLHLQRTMLLYAPLLTFASGSILSDAAKLSRLGQSRANPKQIESGSLALIAAPQLAPNVQLTDSTSQMPSANAQPSPAPFEPIPLLATLLPNPASSALGKPFTAR